MKDTISVIELIKSILGVTLVLVLIFMILFWLGATSYFCDFEGVGLTYNFYSKGNRVDRIMLDDIIVEYGWERYTKEYGWYEYRKLIDKGNVDVNTDYNSGDAWVWVNKEKVTILTMHAWGATAQCKGDTKSGRINKKKVNLIIDGERFYSDPEWNNFSVDYDIPYTGLPMTKIKTEMDYDGDFKQTRNIEVNWLSSEEFEKFKMERARAEEDSGGGEEEVIEGEG
ncbi:hypothetical protein HQ544_02095 [Candidatus Falkowbacteria bacterium]|nr:hypothetical protein [Candidatus Falkowbacteria bacterium]